MKKKSSKLAKLEKNRFSIFTDNFKKCFYCDNKRGIDIHEVYGGSNRQRSMKNGLCVPLCRNCHSNVNIIMDLRKLCQKIYEKNHTRDEFIKLIGKSYL